MSETPSPSDVPPPDEPPPGVVRWFFRRVYRACWNVDFYRRPPGEPWRDAALYFLGLWLLLGLSLGGVEAYRTWIQTDRIGADIQRQIPTIHFRNGDLEVEAEVPYRMTVLDRYQVVLDPGATLNRLQLDPSVMVVAVNGYLYVRRGPDRFQAVSTRMQSAPAEAEPVLINARTVEEMLFTVQVVLSGLTLVIFLLMEGFRLLLWLLVVSGTGLLLAGMRYNLNWVQTLKLTCYAITPVGLLDVLLYAFGWIPPYAEVLYTGLGVGWLMLAIHRRHEVDSRETPGSEDSPTI